MAGRGLALLSLLLLLLGALCYSLATWSRELGAIEDSTGADEVFDLQADFAYKYFDLVEADLLRDTGTFSAREKLLESVCRKYRDPFRPESRGLHRSWPPLNHFTFFRHGGRDHAMCNILKAGSNSWTVFINQVEEKLSEKGPEKQDRSGNSTAGRPSESCWPDCGAGREHLVQVRHPLQRLLSAYRYVFERTSTYEDSFVRVKSLKQLLGDKFSKLSWPQFVEMLLGNELESHPELHRLGVARATVVQGKVKAEKQQKEEMEEDEMRHHINSPDVWVASHWAPYWFQCGLCLASLRPKYILHMDRLEQEADQLLELLGIGGLGVKYPHALRGEGGEAGRWEQSYYSQLSKTQVTRPGCLGGVSHVVYYVQVWRLFQLYRVDHELFGYSPRQYLQWAAD